MTLGQDIKEVIQELGTRFTIIRDSGNITGGRLDYEPNTQVTKPFIKEHFLETSFVYDTGVVVGDVIEFTRDNRRFLVMNVSNELFEDLPIEKSGVLYKTNIKAIIERPSGEINTQTYQHLTHWEQIKIVDALITDKLYGTFLDEDRYDWGNIDRKALVLYISETAGIAEDDRIKVSGEVIQYGNGISGEEYYQVEAIERNSFPGVLIAYLGEDRRE